MYNEIEFVLLEKAFFSLLFFSAMTDGEEAGKVEQRERAWVLLKHGKRGEKDGETAWESLMMLGASSSSSWFSVSYTLSRH